MSTDTGHHEKVRIHRPESWWRCSHPACSLEAHQAVAVSGLMYMCLDHYGEPPRLLVSLEPRTLALLARYSCRQPKTSNGEQPVYRKIITRYTS